MVLDFVFRGGKEFMMYRIGIIDDVAEDRADIQVAILEQTEDKSRVQFKEYELLDRGKKDVLNEIITDVSDGLIQALIVDFKLDTTAEVIEGWEIVEFVHRETPEFPMVILTHAPDEGRESLYTDADKVYAKKEFLNPELLSTKEMVGNIFLNMKKYVQNREKLEAELEAELLELDKKSTDEEVLRRVMELESQLKGYKQMYQTVVDTSLDFGELKEVLSELKQYEELLK